MDRRGFLQTLSSFGIALGIPGPAIATAPESDIRKAWNEALANPVKFDVEWNTLSIHGFREPETRRDCVNFEIPNKASAADLISIAKDNWRVKNIISGTYYDSESLDGDPEDVKEKDWIKWLKRRPRNVSIVVDKLNSWLDERGFDEWDCEEADKNGKTAQSGARRFWINKDELMEKFSIGIVDGDRPGSSYYAAELYIDVDSANEIARRNRIPIYFQEMS